SSNNATIDIAPGATAGGSVITIKNEPTKRWHVNGDIDNYGSRSTGQEEASATVGIDNPLGFNDLWSLTYRLGTDIEEWSKQANAVNGFVSVPYGYTTFTLGFSSSDYRSFLETAGPTLPLRGNSTSQFFAVDHVFYRDQDQKFTGSATLTM